MDHTMAMRGMIVQGVVLGVDDTGEQQTITVQTHDGVVRTEVPVMSGHGVGSHASAGGTALLLAVEGDQGNYVALPVGLISTRFGALPAGASVLYDDAGNRILLPGDGTMVAATAALIKLITQLVVIQVADQLLVQGKSHITGDVTIDGNLTVGKDLRVTGSITAGGSVTATGPVTGGR